MTKILSIVETAYRATIEEQDDTILWFNHILKSSGGDVSILLRANAVNYAVQGQDASGLRFGKLSQIRPPTIDKDLSALIQKGTPVYVLTEDAAERGLTESEFVSGIQQLSRDGLPHLLDQFDQVWHW